MTKTDDRWRTDFENCPEGVRVLLWVPPYGPSTGHISRDGKWVIHSVLNSEAKPTHWQHVHAPARATLRGAA